MVQPGVIFIRRPPRLLTGSFASTRTPWCHHVPSVPPRNLCPGFEAQTRKPVTDGFEAQTTKPAPMVLRTKPPNPADGFEDETTKPPILTRVRPPPSLTPSPSFFTWPSSLRQGPRHHRPPSWLDRRRLHHPCTLALVDVSDVSHRGWSPGLLVPRSKPHVRPSPLLVHRHGTSLLDLLLAVDHCLRAPHLHNKPRDMSHT
jgi:hypothetical protein